LGYGLKAEKLFLELEQLLEQNGYQIRKERGGFVGSDCLVEGDKLVIVNKNKPIESQLKTLATVLAQIPLEGLFVKPVIRKELQKLWGQLQLKSNIQEKWGDLE
jgi:hypothetical protein